MSHLGKEGPKKLLHEPISVFHLLIFDCKMNLEDPRMSLITSGS